MQDQFICRYRRLSEQSESIQQRLNSISSVHSDDSTAPIDNAPFTSSAKQTFSQSYPYQTTSSYPMASTWSQSHSAASSNHSVDMASQASLYEINQQIKLTLTELLNCDGVKHDKMFRAWVQTRLMEAEHQLKRQRRRRSSMSPEIKRTHENNPVASGLSWRSSF